MTNILHYIPEWKTTIDEWLSRDYQVLAIGPILDMVAFKESQQHSLHGNSTQIFRVWLVVVRASCVHDTIFSWTVPADKSVIDKFNMSVPRHNTFSCTAPANSHGIVVTTLKKPSSTLMKWLFDGDDPRQSATGIELEYPKDRSLPLREHIVKTHYVNIGLNPSKIVGVKWSFQEQITGARYTRSRRMSAREDEQALTDLRLSFEYDWYEKTWMYTHLQVLRQYFDVAMARKVFMRKHPDYRPAKGTLFIPVRWEAC